ncbi:MAG: hypothetical protein A2086_07565 [Spirochaetes bacterium GWD1_27_9]|nr:MAG: hypothetical protein A2086_07565 [Spirochaetes bacterium GWD1_27_9]
MKGHKKKPILIMVFSILYLLNPIGNILFLLFFNTTLTPSESFSRLIALLSQGNVIVIFNVLFWIFALPLAYGLFKVRVWAWYYFLVHSIGMVILSIFGSDYKIHISVATFLNILFLIPIGYFISQEIRAVYFNPRLRWWEQAKRFHHSVTVEMEGKKYSTYDISESGAFIVNESTFDFETEELLPVTMKLDEYEIKCFAEIRWLNDKADKEKNKYPSGYGLKFDRISFKDRLKIRDFIQGIVKELGKEEAR